MSEAAVKTSPVKKFAVITPIYKHSGLVTEAIESVLRQRNGENIVHVLIRVITDAIIT